MPLRCSRAPRGSLRGECFLPSLMLRACTLLSLCYLAYRTHAADSSPPPHCPSHAHPHSAETDQGFFLYMYRMRHTIGSDLRVLSPCRRGVLHSNREAAPLSHYNYGNKPQAVLAARACAFESMPAFLKRTSGLARSANASDRPERFSWEIGRAVAWGTNALAEIDSLDAALSRSANATERGASSLLWLPACRATLQSGLNCTMTGLDRWPIALTNGHRRHKHMMRRIRARRRARGGESKSVETVSAGDYVVGKFKDVDEWRPRLPLIS